MNLINTGDENSKIDPTSDSEEYDHTVNTILFSSFDDGKLEISPTDSTTLRSIASQCAFEGGPGVYHARALYSFLDTIIFDDYDICGTVSPRSSGRQSVTGPGLSLFPNPASDAEPNGKRL